ncbi:hypothetical protein ISG33_14255 [Glaciecola sp. MH2013]|uniref:hypothetical protein n=1 Tax=Glaciecola sp. MH2013 TaxID=2785524 RepID=UPI0018A12690|nr:hypothetical protein [Glaciecola sp. MH2013]MBF7074564.1 hypothetical protein [Glaciecola sp. MH2013]
MIIFRQCLAAIFFLFACFTVIFVIRGDLALGHLVSAYAFFLLAYAAWPRKSREQLESDSKVGDILEIIIEFPIELIVYVFRLLRAIFSKSNIDLDI